ncbi:hypothetical protein K4L06_13480 [Lysobacter sp. BMK333-48F3]|uniref:hypothetical protein n=1 Tax=Lysobacter sp. BMK333-48F3 TaxID=2867962 RepID=UPI001C8B2DCD|nr:hypothetical protein [Lysobacter sp. BMK333-48F3]MBX9402320.1 hypothetical protein [Lysobacter sp. BMK333-48F3]
MNVQEIKRQLIAIVRELLDTEPASKAEMKDWYEKAREAKALMELDVGELDVPHALWHYLEDADIRLKDPEYSKVQIAHIEETIRDWAAGS